MINNTVNIKFLQKNNLIKTTLLGLFFWLLIFFLVPLKVKYELGFFPVLFIFMNYIFFFLGIKIVSTTKQKDKLSFRANRKKLISVFWVVICLAYLGFFLKVFDKFFIRGASLNFSMSFNRILLEKSGPSIVSILSAITSPFSFLPLFLHYTIDKNNFLRFILSIVIFFLPILDFMMMGSRSGIFVILIMFGLYLFYFKKVSITVGQVIAISIFLVITAIYSTQLFVERTKDFAKTDKNAIEHILNRSNYNFTLEPNSDTKEKIINSKNKTLQAGRLTTINFAQYYLHGMYEFGYLYNNYDNPHYFGAYTFNILAKFINIVFKTKINLVKIQNAPPRTGVYTTFFGPIYVDFSWFSLLFMFFFGVFQKNIYNKCLKGRFQFIPLLFYCFIINFFMPVFNFINGAQGLYNIVCFLLFIFIYIFLTGKLRINKTQFVRILKDEKY